MLQSIFDAIARLFGWQPPAPIPVPQPIPPDAALDNFMIGISGQLKSSTENLKRTLE